MVNIQGYHRASLWLKAKESTAGVAGDWGSIPGSEDPLEEGMATLSSIPAWRIPRAEEPGRLQSVGSQSRTRPSDSAHMQAQ